ncbi:MAG TPA: flagellar biosynthesis protein FlgI [Pseudohongiella sp.]|nr:flagellar biosynthesis protein FlgI [Pseudohongiella sp.]MAY56044.1 flagellar biosynthesis protein FlgI [Gammaproteobacteria bacterium]HBN13697.1 flagellar biosynthesis protein FlgI [Pseudohongiella sp.]HBX37843.1 flagellar biosynthesis protein FlgI [Pseudohongiella sp.]|tara:strand:+ start:1350 stop:2531 length:1182 start_codon:yes stop_codon:yes gene_type:complete
MLLTQIFTDRKEAVQTKRTKNTLARVSHVALSLVIVLQTVLVAPAQADRLKDIADLQGVQSNQLVGVGLVTGLDGTGDQTTQAPFTAESFRAYLDQFGIPIPQGQNFQLGNVAVVSVQAELPPFAKPGQQIDVTVSSLANADSLRGGTLERTFLMGMDGEVYATAQGNLIVGGLGVEGADGSRISINIPSVGRIPGGAMTVKEVQTAFNSGDHITFNLKRADFTTARRVSRAINDFMGEGTASAIDAVSIQVRAPADSQSRVAYMSELENIQVDQGDAPARVIVNSRTGTIVIGEHVRVSPAAITHGSLSVTISEGFAVSQPAPFGDGETVVLPQSDITVEQENNRMFLFDAGTTLSDIVQAINAVGAAPGDLAAILEALKQSGSLRAELVVI